ncbi:hypothetical protein E2542_SST29403 [Spatholobus suberectus]|nr:hypothetical protein E2542_SST29403 [Spatholobus suberectus]
MKLRPCCPQKMDTNHTNNGWWSASIRISFNSVGAAHSVHHSTRHKHHSVPLSHNSTRNVAMSPLRPYPNPFGTSLSTRSSLHGSSLESDSFEEVTSPASSSSLADDQPVVVADSLSDMSSLFQQLPIKRGLSKFYQGKSQSFTSLTNVRSLEDLAKPENPYNKRLKSCKSYGGGLAESHRAKCNLSAMSRAVSKRE